MKKEEATKFITDSDAEEFIVRTKSQDEEFTKNLKEETIEKEVKPIAGEIHSRYEKDINEVTGEDKPDGMKAYDWNKKLLKQFKTQATTATELNEKVQNLEKQIKDGDGDGALKKRNEELSGEIKKLETRNKETTEKLGKELQQERATNKRARIKTELTYALTGFKWIDPSLLNEKVRTTFIDSVLGEVTQIADFDDGKLVFRDTEKNLMRNEDSSVMTPTQMLTKKLEGIIDKGKQQNGLGQDGKKKKKDEKDLGETFDVPNDISTKQELTSYLRSKGYNPADPRYTATLAKHKDLPY